MSLLCLCLDIRPLGGYSRNAFRVLRRVDFHTFNRTGRCVPESQIGEIFGGSGKAAGVGVLLSHRVEKLDYEAFEFLIWEGCPCTDRLLCKFAGYVLDGRIGAS